MTGDIRFSLRSPLPLERTGELWLRLEEESPPSFFTSWTWLETWLRCLPAGVQPQLLLARREDRIVGAAFLVLRTVRRRAVLKVRQWHFNSTGDPALDCIAIEHNGFLGPAAARGELWAAFLAWFAGQGDADELVVPAAADGEIATIPGDMPLLHRATPAPAFARGLAPGGVEDILAGLSRNARQQLRRNIRDWREIGELTCTKAGTVETALDWFGKLKVLHIRSWDDRRRPHGFRYPFVEAFHRALIGCGTSMGATELVRVCAGPVPVGYLYNFCRGETVTAYQSGFDYSHSKLRPGYVAHVLAMAESAGAGARTYDFLAGDNRLKRTLADTDYAMCSHVFAKPLPGLRLEAAARNVVRRLPRRRE